MIAMYFPEVLTVEVFKTTMQDKQQSVKVAQAIKDRFDLVSVNFDLEDCDRILRVEGSGIDAEAIIIFLKVEEVTAEVLV